jgi:hypothetical protein
MKGAGGVLLGLVLIGALAGGGAFMALRPTPEETAARVQHVITMNAIAEQRAALLTPMVALGGLALGLLAVGAAFYGVLLLRKRAHLVHADAHGIFPLVRVRIGAGEVVHDPNRQAVATTVYAPGADGRVLVMPVVIGGLEDASRAAVAQAATVQAIRAGVSGGGGLLPEHVQGVARRLFPDPGAAAALPRVRVVGDGRVEAYDRLLMAGEDGKDEPSAPDGRAAAH